VLSTYSVMVQVGSDAADGYVIQASNADTDEAVGVRVLLGQAFGNRVHLRLCRLQGYARTQPPDSGEPRMVPPFRRHAFDEWSQGHPAIHTRRKTHAIGHDAYRLVVHAVEGDGPL
jgi:hypothetical protein